MFGKMILPYLGGSPSVWNTCMVFYQALLLLGYIYAHFSTKILGIKKQSILHIILMILPFVVLPIKIPFGWNPPVIENPIPGVISLMLISIGLPFFVLSTTSPMLQKWFSSTNHPLAKDPYFLYVSSNIGSMIALFSYPFIIEPALRLTHQSYIWSLLYSVFFILMTACVFFTNKNLLVVKDEENNDQEEQTLITNFNKLKWVALAFVPSSLMLGVTSYISIDISPIPLFWIIPLAIYLLTFILTFSTKPLIKHDLIVRAMPFMVSILLFYTFVRNNNSEIWTAFALHLVNFFICSMVCHGELSKSRPAAKYLTEFYIWISVGGFLGGVFNALLAPIVFKEVVEYPLVIVLACILKPGKDKEIDFKNKIIEILTPGFLFLVLNLVAKDLGLYKMGILVQYLVYSAPILLCLRLINNSLYFGLSLASLILIVTVFFNFGLKSSNLFIERNFFGIHRISIDSEQQYLQLYQDTTLHGTQRLDQRDRCYPLTYYHPSGPIGQMFRVFYNDTTKKRVAAVGLGTGSLACYGREDQEWTFFEIDPTIVALNQSGEAFTYLVNSSPDTKVILGDARLSLSKEKNVQYDFIILDAFSSDAIPLHLITQEALDLYLTRLSPTGIIAFHTSNRHLDLPRVLANLALNRNLHAIIEYDSNTGYPGKTSSEWVLIARKKEYFDALNRSPFWKPLYSDLNTPVWTDDYSNIFSILKDFKI